jgi:integrase
MIKTYKDSQRGSWFYVYFVAVDGQRKQRRGRGYATKKSAAEAGMKAYLAEQGARGVSGSELAFGLYLNERWLPYVLNSALKPTTKQHYTYGVRDLSRIVGTTTLDQLTAEDLDGVQAALRAEGKSDSTLKRAGVTASKALKDAVRWKLISSSPALDANPIPQPKSTPEAWSVEETIRFLKVAREDRWWAVWLLAASGTRRRGEILGLRWSDVDFERRVVTFHENTTVAFGKTHTGTLKGGKGIQVSVDATTLAALVAIRTRQAEEYEVLGELAPLDGLVFTWQDGSAVRPEVITRTFCRLREEANLPRLSLHDLRKAWARAALDAGVSLADVSRRLGHSSIRVTADVYVASSTIADAAAASAVATAFEL